MSLCSSSTTKVKVSSTLDKSVGKKGLIDGNPETCWTSQAGLPQYIQLSFDTPISPTVLSTTFQGGFVGIDCEVHVYKDDQWTLVKKVFPEDVNREQRFELEPHLFQDISGLRLVLLQSSDFFGRITVYHLDLL